MPPPEPQWVAGPFSGVLMIDLTHVLNGRFGTTILCDLGARIIRVEPPHGDDTRAGVRGSTIEERGIAIDRLIHKKHRRGPAVHLPALISTTCRMASRRSAEAATRQGGWG